MHRKGSVLLVRLVIIAAMIGRSVRFAPWNGADLMRWSSYFLHRKGIVPVCPTDWHSRDDRAFSAPRRSARHR